MQKTCMPSQGEELLERKRADRPGRMRSMD
jgi:hypothetical protein